MAKGTKKETARAAKGTVLLEQPLIHHIGFLIRKLYQKNQIIWNEMCVDEQVTSPQASVLVVLMHEGPC